MEEKIKKLLKYYRRALRDSGADKNIAEKIVIKAILEELEKAREEGIREGGRGMLEGFLKHLQNRSETELVIKGEIELSKELFEVYKLKTKEDEK